MEKPIELGVINDVGFSTREYIHQRWGKKFYIIGGLFVLLGIVGLYLNLGFFIFPAFLWFTGGWGIAQKKVREEFMRQFAAKNGFTHEAIGNLLTVHGDLFARGHSKGIAHVVSGTHADLPLRFFFYTYSTGSGKQRRTEYFTVAEVAFKGSLPDMIVDNKSDWYVDDGIDGKHQTVSSGNAFDEYFTLRVKEGLEIEALEVLTPEIMEDLIARGKGCSFEFIRDHLYVWQGGYATTAVELQSLLALAHYLIDSLAPRLSRLHDDVDAVIAAQKVRS